MWVTGISDSEKRKGEALKLIFGTATEKRNECAPAYHLPCRLYSQIARNINYYKYLVTMNEQPCDI